MLYPEVVKPPSTETPVEIRDNKKRFPYFMDCLGALDGSHFQAHIPEKDIVRFRNHHGDVTQNVLAVVDFRMNFTYLLTGWEGTAHDGRVLWDALQNKGFSVPDGKYYVADAGYSNCHETLTPYKKVRYHLREITTAGMQPKDMYELFNFRHSSLRNVVERTFGVFKRRWRIFDRPHEFEFRKQKQLIYALAAVHNFINMHYRVDEDYERLKPHQWEGLDAHMSVESHELSPNQELDLVDERDMDARRDDIAAHMWQQYKEHQAGLDI